MQSTLIAAIKKFYKKISEQSRLLRLWQSHPKNHSNRQRCQLNLPSL